MRSLAALLNRGLSRVVAMTAAQRIAHVTLCKWIDHCRDEYAEERRHAELIDFGGES